MFPEKKRRYHTRLYEAPTKESFMFTAEELPKRGPNGESSRARLYHSVDCGASWREVSLRLDLRSRVVAKFCTSWPPEIIDDVHLEKGTLWITFHDRESEGESSPLPFSLGDESIWKARYVPSRARWRLQRVRRLDYDGKDRHLKGYTPFFYD